MKVNFCCLKIMTFGVELLGTNKDTIVDLGIYCKMCKTSYEWSEGTAEWKQKEVEL